MLPIPKLHAPTIRVSKYVTQKMMQLKRETDKSTIMFGDFITPSQQMIELLDRK